MTATAQPQIPVGEVATLATAANAAGASYGWKNGLLVAGAVGLLVLVGFAVFAQTSQNTAVQKTGESAYQSGAAAARAAADAEKRTL
jgi:hypothetical protein